jgi:hypothetical protein
LFHNVTHVLIPLPALQISSEFECLVLFIFMLIFFSEQLESPALADRGLAKERCAQENVIEQLKNGVNAMRTPVDDLMSNSANRRCFLAGMLSGKLDVVAGSRIKKAAPAGNLTALNGEDVDPFRFKQLFGIQGRCFFPAEDGDVLASLDELPWLKGMNFVCLRKRRKKIGHFVGSSPLPGVWQSLRGNAFPIDFVSDQLKQARDITPPESCVSLLNDIKRCSHG